MAASISVASVALVVIAAAPAAVVVIVVVVVVVVARSGRHHDGRAQHLHLGAAGRGECIQSAGQSMRAQCSALVAAVRSDTIRSMGWCEVQPAELRCTSMGTVPRSAH